MGTVEDCCTLWLCWLNPGTSLSFICCLPLAALAFGGSEVVCHFQHTGARTLSSLRCFESNSTELLRGKAINRQNILILLGLTVLYIDLWLSLPFSLVFIYLRFIHCCSFIAIFMLLLHIDLNFIVIAPKVNNWSFFALIFLNFWIYHSIFSSCFFSWRFLCQLGFTLLIECA